MQDQSRDLASKFKKFVSEGLINASSPLNIVFFHNMGLKNKPIVNSTLLIVTEKMDDALCALVVYPLFSIVCNGQSR